MQQWCSKHFRSVMTRQLLANTCTSKRFTVVISPIGRRSSQLSDGHGQRCAALVQKAAGDRLTYHRQVNVVRDRADKGSTERKEQSRRVID